MPGSPSRPRWSSAGIALVLFLAALSRYNHFDTDKIEGSETREKEPRNIVRRSEEETLGLRSLAKTSSINAEELDFCISSLESVSVDGQVGEEEFIIFLENFSRQPLYFDQFHELPLQLVLVFYTAACTGGRNCSTEKPKISLGDAGSSKAFLYVFCKSVKEVALVQISFKFQYQIRLEASQEGDFISTTSSGNAQTGTDGELIRHLEQATELVLLNDLGCLEEELGSRRTLRDTRSDDENWHVESRDTRSLHQVPLKNKDEVGDTRDDTQFFSRGLYLRETADCDYSVQVAVYRWHETSCLPVPPKVATTEMPLVQEDWTCLLVFSEARVTAASLFQRLSSLELRSTVSSALKTAILGEEFDKYLAAQNLNPS